ncbi:BrnT family toxin [Methylomonas sp. ZR1]|uniref:BrnT family toxin n=1 Tax=unclassified Methylomonas TaxID=2608980 RepID=UPI001491F054|nr:BrnT family toxin [Methylomonas sp. ZR1]NOV32337.1 BrnT family toxin [Methylomonas sp. ZR1]
MIIEFDPAKSARNILERGLSSERVADFDWSSAIATEDVRKDYPERRFVAFGYLDERLHVLCFTPVTGGIRVISFRKANSREIRKYDRTITVN